MSNKTPLYQCAGDYLVQIDDPRVRIPAAPALRSANDLPPFLIEGQDFIVHAGTAMLPVPAYYVHELKSELPACLDALMKEGAPCSYKGIKDLCIEALDAAVLRINEARK